MAHDVFISYSHHDQEIADTICASLESRRIRCWIAPRDVIPGISYGESIINAINHSLVMILLFSNHSNNSQQVEREVERAVNKGIPIIPFRIEDVPLTKSMEYYISSPHWLDALTPPLEAHLDYLSETLDLLLSRMKDSPMDHIPPHPSYELPTELSKQEKTNHIDNNAISAIGIIHLNDKFLTPKHHSDYVDIHFSISNFSKTIQKVPHLWIRISERREINKIRLKKAGAMIQEFQLSATIDKSDVDILSNTSSQLILEPGSTDSFCLQLFGSEGFLYVVTLTADFHDLESGTCDNIVSSLFNIEFPIRSPETLRRRENV